MRGNHGDAPNTAKGQTRGGEFALTLGNS